MGFAEPGVAAGSVFVCVVIGGESAGLAAFFEAAFDGFFAFFFCGFLFLLEAFFNCSVVLFVIELVEIVCFTLHGRWFCCFTTVV